MCIDNQGQQSQTHKGTIHPAITSGHWLFCPCLELETKGPGLILRMWANCFSQTMWACFSPWEFGQSCTTTLPLTQDSLWRISRDGPGWWWSPRIAGLLLQTVPSCHWQWALEDAQATPDCSQERHGTWVGRWHGDLYSLNCFMHLCYLEEYC